MGIVQAQEHRVVALPALHHLDYLPLLKPGAVLAGAVESRAVPQRDALRVQDDVIPGAGLGLAQVEATAARPPDELGLQVLAPAASGAAAVAHAGAHGMQELLPL